MRDARKRANGQIGKGSSDQAAGKVEDPQTQRLLKMGKAVGNDEIQKRLSDGNASRDELLAFLCQRLNTLREAQVRELGFQDDQRDWWKEIADSHKDDYTKPDPTRFSEAAKIYEEAAYQLCRGALGRGAQLVERALTEEQKAFETLPRKVIDIEDLDTEAAGPEALEEVTSTQGCGECPVPEEVAVAREIQNVTTQFADPPVKRRVADPWWTEEEEEEEEESGDAGGG